MIFDYSEALNVGLRRDPRAPVNTLAFQEYRNLRPTRWMAKDFHPVSQPVTDANIAALSKPKAWPFPQAYLSQYTRYLFFSDAVYPLANPFAVVSPMTLLNAHEFGDASPSTGSIASGDAWQFTSFNQTMWATNGDEGVLVSPLGNYVIGLDGETLNNGAFTGGSTGWSLGGGWTYGSNKITHTPGVSSMAQQIFGSQVSGKEIVPGKQYQITFTVADRTAGSVTINGSYVASANGTVTFRHVPSVAIFSIVASSAFDGSIEIVSCKKAPAKIGTVTNWNDGRIVLAGFDPDNFYNMADWPTALTGYDDNFPADFANVFDPAGAQSNMVWFSTIGAPDLYWLLSTNLYMTASNKLNPETGYTTARTYLRHLWKRNESSMMACPWRGDVLAVKQLGDLVMAYGGMNAANEPGGIVGFRDFGGRIGQVNVPNWSMTLGLMNRTAIAGDENRHVFVTEDGTLWQAYLNGNSIMVEELEASEYISELEPSEVVVTFDPYRKEFYVCDSTTGFLLSETGGLCRPPWRPTSLYVSGGSTQGVLHDAASPTSILLETMPFDARAFGGQPGDLFSLHRLRIITSDIGAGADRWAGTVYYRTKNSKDWTAFSSKTFDERGVATIGGIPCVEAFIRATHGDRTETNGLDGLFIEAEMDGIYSTEHWVEAAEPAPATLP